MNGITTRTREEQLDALRRRTALQLRTARRLDDHTTATRLRQLLSRLEQELGLPDTAPRPPKKRADHVTAHLARLGVTSHAVKAWAVTAGLLDQIHRGRISAHLVDAYEHAHPTNQEDQ